MRLQKQPPIEMAPGHDWVSYRSGSTLVAFPEGSDILDRVSALRDVLSCDTTISDGLRGEYLGHGCEADVHVVKGNDDLAVKITDNDSRALRMARYGGVCVERAMNGSTVGDHGIATPHYEAVILDGLSPAVIMSRIDGRPLYRIASSSTFKKVDTDRMLGITRSVTKATLSALVEIGIDPGVEGIIDTNLANIMVKHDDGVIDWSKLTVVDAIRTDAVHPPKLWDSTSVAV